MAVSVHVFDWDFFCLATLVRAENWAIHGLSARFLCSENQRAQHAASLLPLYTLVFWREVYYCGHSRGRRCVYRSTGICLSTVVRVPASGRGPTQSPQPLPTAQHAELLFQSPAALVGDGPRPLLAPLQSPLSPSSKPSLCHRESGIFVGRVGVCTVLAAPPPPCLPALSWTPLPKLSPPL